MKISYDSEIDAVYIRLIEGKHECRTVRLNDEVALNIGADEKLVGIEILDAREVLAAGKTLNLSVNSLTSRAVNLIPLPWPQDGAGMKFCRAVAFALSRLRR